MSYKNLDAIAKDQEELKAHYWKEKTQKGESNFILRRKGMCEASSCINSPGAVQGKEIKNNGCVHK